MPKIIRKSKTKRPKVRRSLPRKKRTKPGSFPAWNVAVALGVFLLGLSYWWDSQPKSKPNRKTSSVEVVENLAGERVAHFSDLVSRFQNISDPVYSKFSIGDAPKIEDSAPLLPESYDCTTFVETVMALVRAEKSKNFFKELLGIRYNQAVSDFWHRNHFPEADWIPNNQKLGTLRDITSEILNQAGLTYSFEVKTIQRGRWLQRKIKAGDVPERNLASIPNSIWRKDERVELPYIPVTMLQAATPYLKSGTVINFVRAAVEKKDVLISHQGFLIKKGEVLYLRHANVAGKIRTVKLDSYLKVHDDKKWPLLGFNLNEVRLP